MDTSAENDVSIPGNALQGRNYCIAVTGDVFRWMIDFGNEDVLNRVSRFGISRSTPRFYTDGFLYDLDAGYWQSVCPDVTR
jgi:hypothetical protein